MILVYEHASNKSLDDYLKNVDYDNNLTWTQRLHMCLEIAHGLDHLHTKIDIQHRVIRGDIVRSANILLGKNWEPKIAYFGILECNSTNQEGSIVIRKKLLSDPELEKLRVTKQESDIYSFGVILFEIFCGRLAYEKDEGLAPIARQCFNDGTIKDMIDPNLKEATDEDIITSNRGPNQDSLDAFLKIAYRCLEEVEAERPTLKDVIKELEIALNYQENLMKSLQIPLKDIERATEKFSQKNFFGSGRYWKAYKGKLPHANGSANTPIVAKRWDTTFNVQFQTELNILFKRKHENIIGLIGYCDELNEKIIVYEHMSKGSLDKHLEDPSLTWMKRLKICVDVAKGLEFLHTNQMKHRGITSGSVLLDGHWTARISNLELTCKSSVNNRDEHIDNNAYVDPKYQFRGFANEKSDIYSLGVILFEMLCGRLAWTPGCEDESKSLGSFVVRHYTERGNLDEMIFKDIKEQIVPQSLTTFQRVALQCLKDECVDRPEASDVVIQLKKALKFQENIKGNLHISLQAIELGTQNSSHSKCIGEGIFWKLYEGEVTHANGCTIIFAKQWDNMSRQAYYQFWTELECLFKYNHKNIIGLVGYCNEMNEKIIFYEHASNGRLSTHLDDPILTWRKRLKICIDIVNGLEFLHTGGVELEDSILHRDIKSGSILLDGGWNAKISNLELSCSTTEFERAEHVDDMACNSLGYVDPQYQIDGFLSEKSDIYSLGVILIEMLCGRLAWAQGYEDHSQSLGPLAVRYYNEKGNLDGMIFEGIKKQIAPKSLTTFLRIAIQCLKDDMVDRPSIREAGIQLKMALEFQEDYEIWEPKMPLDLEQIIQTSATPEIYSSTELKKDLHNMLSKGILRQDCKVLSSLGISGETNKMISARNFSYENRGSHKWRSIHKSRFPKVAKVFDISNLQIRINIATQFLSLGVNYGAYFVFKFCNTRKFSCKPVYVNLKYKMGGETLHAYFATWRDNDWMMIELWRFLSHKKDTSFEVLLESFSSYYCGRGPIHVNGIEFRVIDNVIDSHEMCKRSENEVGEAEKSILLNEVNGKKHLRLSAKEVSNVKLSADSRYQEVVELLPQQVFRINCKIQSQVLSPDAKYLCYLVFKLSEKCHGLHCPVKVRDLLHRNNKEAEIIYFRCPSPWNLHDNNSYPEQREDGWMEVKVCKFNSNHQLRNDCMKVNLKFITYEGTMSGLILCGLELRPMYT